MAASGYTPISLYYSTTASAAPTAGNLVSGELAINITDGKLYYKDNAGAVQLLSTSTTATGTANGVLYLNGSKVATSGSALVFDGNNMGVGTSSPASYTNFKTLEIGAGGGTKGGLLRISGASNTVIGYFYADSLAPLLTIGSDTSTDFNFVTGATERMRLTSTGLGIGTSSPAVKLQVYNNINGTPFAWGNATRTGYLYQDQNGVGITNASGTSFDEGVYLDTANSKVILYTNSTDRVTLDSSGNLGVGTASPATRLDVANSGTPVIFSMTLTGAQRWQQIIDTTAGNWTLKDQTGNVNSLVAAAGTGNLGLGVTPSTWSAGYSAIQIGASSSAYAMNSGNDFHLGLGATYNAGWKYTVSSVAVSDYFQTSGQHIWRYAASGTSGNALTWSEGMRLDASGTLLVGHSSNLATGAKALLKGSLVATSSTFDNASTGGAISVFCDNANYGTIWALKNGNTAWGDVAIAPLGGNVGIGTSSIFGKLNIADSTNGRFEVNCISTGVTLEVLNSGRTNAADLGFYSKTFTFNTKDGGAYTEKARIDSSGNLLVGTTSVIDAGKVSVLFDNSSANGISIKMSSTTYNNNLLSFRNPSNTQVGYIYSNGTTTSYGTSSDYRLKNTIAPMTGALAKVALLKPCTYKWNADGSDGEGFIAHELAEVVPQAVTGQKDAVDEEGNPKYQGIDTSFLVATLTAAIQELKSELDSVKAELATLKGN